MSVRRELGLRGRRGLLAALLASSCLPGAGTSGPDTTPAGPKDDGTIRLFVPNVSRVPGAVMPIQVEVETDGIAGDKVCVALRSDPGAVTWAFPEPCDGQAAAPTDAGGASVGGEGGAPAEGSTSQSCLALTKTTTFVSVSQRGAAIARYTPKAIEETVVLFGAVYRALDCSGPTLAEATLVVRMAIEEGSGGTGGAPAGGGAGSQSGGSGAGGEPPGGQAGAGGDNEAGQPSGGMPTDLAGQGGEAPMSGGAGGAGGSGDGVTP